MCPNCHYNIVLLFHGRWPCSPSPIRAIPPIRFVVSPLYPLANGVLAPRARSAVLVRRESLILVMRRLFSLDWRAALELLVQREAAVDGMLHFVQRNDTPERWRALIELAACFTRAGAQKAADGESRAPAPSAEGALRELLPMLEAAGVYAPQGGASRGDGKEPASAQELLLQLRATAQGALDELATHVLPKMIRSAACYPMLESLISGEALSLEEQRAWFWEGAARLWDGVVDGGRLTAHNSAPNWLLEVATLGMQLPCLCSISDLSADDNPLIFVNDAFVATTGYTRSKALGRNCRFLQGSATEAQPADLLHQSLDSRSPCVVQLTSYRADGSAFPMLLAMRPLVSACRTYSFCVAFHREITPNQPARQLGMRLAHLLSLLPDIPSVKSPNSPRRTSLRGGRGRGARA